MEGRTQTSYYHSCKEKRAIGTARQTQKGGTTYTAFVFASLAPEASVNAQSHCPLPGSTIETSGTESHSAASSVSAGIDQPAVPITLLRLENR